ATCNAHGAADPDKNQQPKWKLEHSEQLRGAKLCVFNDNDRAGYDHAEATCKLSLGIAECVRRLDLKLHWPDMPEKADVSDWLDAFHTREELDALMAAAPDYPPKQPGGPKLVLTLAEWAARDLAEPDFILGYWLTTTSRVIMTAPTGIGKTMLAMGIGMASAAALGFLHWRGVRKARVLFIDGEMSRRLLKERLAAEVARLGLMPDTFFALSHEDVDNMQPLNTAAGQQYIDGVIRDLGGVDAIIFDNVMALIAGDQKDEEGWRQTLPWVKSLTQRNIGQLWVHHTGHDESRGYGTKTREWQMDTVEHLER